MGTHNYRNTSHRVILVSPSTPEFVNEAQKELGTAFPVLYDTLDRYRTELKIASYPFNILVDSDLTIKRIVVGALTTSECRTTLNNP